MTMTEAIIFDFDGLMINTEEAVLHSLQEIFKAHGAYRPPAVWLTSIGSTDAFDPFEYLTEQVDRPIDREAARANYRGGCLLPRLHNLHGGKHSILDHEGTDARRGAGRRTRACLQI